jgi:hypothetical protein
VQRSGGTVSFGGDATWTEDGFQFPARSDDGLRFSGEAALRAHGGLLSVDLVDPQIEHDGERLVVTVSNLEGSLRFAFAELVETTADGSRRIFTTAITAETSNLLGGTYPVGAEFEPLYVDPPRPAEPH